MTQKKILIVDDEMDMRIYLASLVKTSGYQPLVTKNGDEGLQKAKTERPDLVILDVMMPGKGGVSMYRELRTDDKLKDIPVIMLSGVTRKSYSHYLKMMNISPNHTLPEPEAYLEKPPDSDELIRQIQTFLQ
jgi:DNA-binding response OmpR family regulator